MLARRMLAGALACAVGTIAQAKVFRTVDEALAAAFPGCQVERSTFYLTPEQQRHAAKLADTPVDSRLVIRYTASCDGRPGGAAYFDTHRVRTLPETVMVVVTPEGRVGRVETLNFDEPQEYLPPPRWFGQFDGRLLDEELALKRAIRLMTGATLTSRATVAAVRRVLAVDAVIRAVATAPAPVT